MVSTLGSVLVDLEEGAEPDGGNMRAERMICSVAAVLILLLTGAEITGRLLYHRVATALFEPYYANARAQAVLGIMLATALLLYGWRERPEAIERREGQSRMGAAVVLLLALLAAFTGFGLNRIAADSASIRSDVSSMESNVSSIDIDLSGIEDRVSSIDTDVTEIGSTVDEIKSTVDGIGSR